VASHRQIGLNLLVEASPNRSLNMERRPVADEIRPQIDLMAIYGLIGIEKQMGVRVCFAPGSDRWADAQRIKAVKPGKKQRPSIVLPLIAATLVATATTACSSFPGMTQSTPAPVASVQCRRHPAARAHGAVLQPEDGEHIASVSALNVLNRRRRNRLPTWPS
jgi:hypothetical protein